MRRRVSGPEMGIEFPENPQHQLEGCGHEVMVRPVSVVAGFSPATFSRPITVADLAESNQFGYVAK